MNLYTLPLPSPFGEMVASVDESGALVRLLLPGEKTRRVREEIAGSDRRAAPSAPFDTVLEQLGLYFRRELKEFELPLKPEGTPFQQKVWSALQTIPYGTTITYKELAQRVGSLSATRAVGRANGANPIPIVIPCHRVIGSDGSLTGFGGGMALKASLLRLEGAKFAGSSRPTEQLSLP